MILFGDALESMREAVSDRFDCLASCLVFDLLDSLETRPLLSERPVTPQRLAGDTIETIAPAMPLLHASTWRIGRGWDHENRGESGPLDFLGLPGTSAAALARFCRRICCRAFHGHRTRDRSEPDFQ